MKIPFFPFILVVLLASAPLLAVAEGADDQREKNLHALGELIGKSSISRQVLSSNNEASKQKYKLAQTLHEQAASAYREGKFDESDMLMSKSKKALFEAAKLSRSRENRKDKEELHYETVKRSLNALLDAMQRIGAEKSRNKQVEPLAENARKQIKHADQYFSDGKYKDGTELLVKAMHEIDNAINGMRSGDTLVRSLDFATPKEEYQYERERNDAHLMLVKVYLEEKPVDNEARGKVDQHLGNARMFRTKAEEMASNDKYQDAVREMESSTLNIVRAIRALGVYIPG